MSIYNYYSLTQNDCLTIILGLLWPRLHLVGEIMFEGQNNICKDPD